MSAESAITRYPDNWGLTTLGELCAKSGGKIQTGPFGSQLHAADYVAKGIPSIMPKNISVEGISTEDIAYITDEDAERLSKYLVRKGDIIYSRRGDVEKCSHVTEREDGWRCGTGCLRVRLGANNKVSSVFIHAYLSHPAIREWIVRHAIGATMPNLNTSILSNVPVLIPSDDERAIIENIWWHTTKKIVVNRKINQTLEQIAQTIFKSWFVDFEPVKAKIEAKQNGQDPERVAMSAISGKSEADLDQLPSAQLAQLAVTSALFPDELVDSEQGMIPKGWSSQIANDIADVAIGKTPPRKELEWFSESDDDIRWMSIRDMGVSGVYAINTSEYLTEEAVNKVNVRRIPDNTVLLSFKMTVGRVVITAGEMLSNEAIAHFNLTEDSPVSTEFLYLYLKQFNYSNLASTSSIATAVNSKTIKNMPIIIPSNELKQEFTGRVESLFRKIKTIQQENESLIETRDSLLQKLLSGEVEVVQ